MSKPKVGDKFIIEITNEDAYGGYYVNNMFFEDYEFNELQSYHVPTLQDCAKILKENVAKDNCKNCPFDCDSLDKCPQYWKLKTDLTDKEQKTLEYWKYVGATSICKKTDSEYAFVKYDTQVGEATIKGIFEKLEIGKTYSIDDLLEGG